MSSTPGKKIKRKIRKNNLTRSLQSLLSTSLLSKKIVQPVNPKKSGRIAEIHIDGGRPSLFAKFGWRNTLKNDAGEEVKLKKGSAR